MEGGDMQVLHVRCPGHEDCACFVSAFNLGPIEIKDCRIFSMKLQFQSPEAHQSIAFLPASVIEIWVIHRWWSADRRGLVQAIFGQFCEQD
jgi:hypothetical protein